MFTIDNAGSWAVNDRYSTTQGAPPVDAATNDYTSFTLTSNGNINTYSVKRLLETADPEDFNITDGTTNMIYSFGSGVSLGYHGAGVYGAFSFTIDKTSRDVIIGDGSITHDTEKTLIHGLLNYLAWGWMSFFLIISGRYSKYFYSFRTYVHASLGILTLIFNAVAVIGYGEASTPRPPKNFLGEEHTSISGVVLWWALITIIFGILVKASGLFFGRFSFISYYMWFVHVIVGSLLIIYSQIAILSGLYLYDSPITALFYVHLGLMILMIIVLEVLWQFNKTWKYMDILKLSNTLPEMTLKEVKESNKKLAIFDQFVINLGGYFFDHPGGKYVLDQCVGQEIGKYFYGAYSLDDNIKVHKHSFIAGKILSKLAVGKLSQPEETKSLVSKSAKIGDVKDSNSEISNPESLNYKVVGKQEILPYIYRVKFSNKDTKFKIISKGTSSFGKHYIVNSLSNQV